MTQGVHGTKGLHVAQPSKLRISVLTATRDCVPVYSFNSGEFSEPCYWISFRVALSISQKGDWGKLSHALVEIHKDFGAQAIEVSR